MGLSRWIAARAVRATRVLVVEGGDGFVARVAIERAMRARGWRDARSPADADALIVAGDANAEFEHVVARLWDAMPGPRARAWVAGAAEVESALAEVARSLADGAHQDRDARERSGLPASAHADDPEQTDGDHAGPDHGEPGGDHSDGGRGSHDVHGDMDMAPDGIALAEGAEDDRDGLEMDALPVRLGPVLPHWPPGLVLDTILHGDLVVKAEARILARPSTALAGGDPADAAAIAAARRCDELVTFLALAGWGVGVDRAGSARNACLGHRFADADATLQILHDQARRSRLLEWSLAGVGVVSAERAAELGLPRAMAGDCRHRLLRLVEAAESATAFAASPDAPPTPARGVPAAALGPLVSGCDLAVVRLIIASMGMLTAPAEVLADG